MSIHCPEIIFIGDSINAYALRDAYPGKCAVRESNVLTCVDDIVADAIVSPANSWGFMDGGIDAVYTQMWGPKLQEKVQEKIFKQHENGLVIGTGFFVDLPEPIISSTPQVKKMLIVPTMYHPQTLASALDIYLAWTVVFKLCRDLKLEKIICPSMGTGAGRLRTEYSVNCMLMAYKHVFIFPFKPTCWQQVVEMRYQLERL